MLKNSFYALLLLLSLGQLTALDRINGSGVYLFDFAVAAFVFFGLTYFLRVKGGLKFPKFSAPFLLFVLFCTVSLTVSLFRHDVFEIIPGFLYLLRFVLYLLSGVVLFNMFESGKISDKEFYYAVVSSGILISILGFIQLVLLPDFSVLEEGLGWDPHKNRLASTFLDPNFTGVYLAMCAAVIFKKYYVDRKAIALDIFFFTIITVALFLTFSRSAWAAFAVMIFIFGFYKSKTLLLVSLLAAFSAYFAVPRVQTRLVGITDPADSAKLRIESWVKAVDISKDNMLIGVGFNNFKIAQREYGYLDWDTDKDHSSSGSDSSLLLVLATSGVVGLGVFLLGYWQLFFTKWESNLLMLALGGGLLIDSLFINSLFYPQIMFLMFSIYSFSRT